MKVQDILDKKANSIISFIGPELKVLEAVRFMCDNKIGSLLVQDKSGKTIGIITERDVFREINRNLEGFGEVVVSDIMTTDLICGLPEDEVDYVMQVMTKNKIRHLPVVKDKKVVGLISIGDIVNSNLEETRVQNHKLLDYLELSGKL